MSKGLPKLVEPTRWLPEKLETDLAVAIQNFRDERLQEPLAAYLEAYDQAEEIIEGLLRSTDNLMSMEATALALFQQPDSLDALRYLAAPPISEDDLKILVDSASLAPRTFTADPALAARLVQTIQAVIDPRRFPWHAERREATREERQAAVMASTVLIAAQRLATRRRSEGKQVQETLVRQTLLDHGLEIVAIPGNAIQTLSQAPGPGKFCSEAILGTRKADFVVGLWDTRILAIECKVSNSSLNSVNRLNNDAAAKAEEWLKDFGVRNIVPAAVLSGVYKLHNLLNAQQRGLTLYWAHRLVDLTGWIESVRIQAPTD
ncbi:XamI family restriction endonuclease [Caldilinea sp.]|uniref:XamI family restriction endonuclease n=1 Tax=Caldilinea sp. TaxID=2293560 RepID=UPI002C147BC7|nr:XamI family restriction endonuclease [Caldilinea sp.]